MPVPGIQDLSGVVMNGDPQVADADDPAEWVGDFFRQAEQDDDAEEPNGARAVGQNVAVAKSVGNVSKTVVGAGVSLTNLTTSVTAGSGMVGSITGAIAPVAGAALSVAA